MSPHSSPIGSGLTVRDVTIRYSVPGRGTLVAVDSVSLDVAAGEVVALVGPSGSGKSSLLRAIAGLEPLVGGSVAWDGDDLTRVPTARRGVGMMFQDAQLFGHLTVAQNVGYGLNRVPRAERASRVAELLELVGLGGHGDRKVTQLSGGQAQRVALARALAPRPRILLLDEPLAALDRELREHLTGVLAATLRATHTTAVHVTHDQDEAFALGDRVGVMMDGHLRQIDTPAELWRRPAREDVARFLGYGPVIDAATAVALGGQGRLAVGPEALVPGDVRVPVIGLIPRRDHVDIEVTLPDGQSATMRRPVSDGIPRPGDEVSVRLDPDRCAPLS